MTRIGTTGRTTLEQRAPAQLMEATVLDPPVNEAGWLRVETDAQPGVVQECPWDRPADMSPLPGDAAAVQESDDGNYWALWWPQNGQTPQATGGGGSLQGTWAWSTATGDPSARHIGINTGAWATATQINISETADAGADASNILSTLKAGDSIYLQDSGDSTKWARYQLTAAGTDQGAWRSFPVTYVNSAGAPPANNRDTAVVVGLAGGAAAGGDKNYVHTQTPLAAVWTVAHNLGKFPAVTVVDSGGSEVVPNLHYNDANTLTVTFAAATSGKVYVN